MKWYVIANIVFWILGKIMQDENKNGTPDIFEKGGPIEQVPKKNEPKAE